MSFVVNNLDKFQTNNSVYVMGTQRNDHLHLPLAHLSSYQKGVYYSGINLFNTASIYISDLKNDKKQFRLVLCNYLQSNVFYSIDEFLNHAKDFKVKS
jgi:hypothetical protein